MNKLAAALAEVVADELFWARPDFRKEAAGDMIRIGNVQVPADALYGALAGGGLGLLSGVAGEADPGMLAALSLMGAGVGGGGGYLWQNSQPAPKVETGPQNQSGATNLTQAAVGKPATTAGRLLASGIGGASGLAAGKTLQGVYDRTVGEHDVRDFARRALMGDPSVAPEQRNLEMARIAAQSGGERVVRSGAGAGEKIPVIEANKGKAQQEMGQFARQAQPHYDNPADLVRDLRDVAIHNRYSTPGAKATMEQLPQESLIRAALPGFFGRNRKLLGSHLLGRNKITLAGGAVGAALPWAATAGRNLFGHPASDPLTEPTQ